MKENFEVDINKLTKEEKEKFLKLVEKGNESIIRKRWRGEENDTYYSISNRGILITDRECCSSVDDCSYQFGNYFKTEEEAIFAKKKQLVYQQLKDYALEHNTEAIDGDNFQQDKWLIRFNAYESTIEVYNSPLLKDIGQIYFTSKEIAENAIKEIGRNKIRYYLF